LPKDKNISRFLAKIALEALAQKLMDSKGGVEYIVSETQFDVIRSHARQGVPKDWPYSSRRIYSADDEKVSPNGEVGQLVHEYDFLSTDLGEMYFVLVLYGVEMTINLAGPSIEGYEDWLEQNGGVSPLYHGKNSC
jgi:hypothetical protein